MPSNSHTRMHIKWNANWVYKKKVTLSIRWRVRLAKFWLKSMHTHAHTPKTKNIEIYTMAYQRTCFKNIHQSTIYLHRVAVRVAVRVACQRYESGRETHNVQDFKMHFAYSFCSFFCFSTTTKCSVLVQWSLFPKFGSRARVTLLALSQLIFI